MFVCELNYNDNIQSFPVSFSTAVTLNSSVTAVSTSGVLVHKTTEFTKKVRASQQKVICYWDKIEKKSVQILFL